MWNLSDTASWAALLGIVTPLGVALVNQTKWSPQVKTLVAVVVAVAVGVLDALAHGQLQHPGTVVGAVVLVLGASQAAYHLLWQPGDVAPALERATSVSRPAPPAAT
jgi:hypothetical protein